MHPDDSGEITIFRQAPFDILSAIQSSKMSFNVFIVHHDKRRKYAFSITKCHFLFLARFPRSLNFRKWKVELRKMSGPPGENVPPPPPRPSVAKSLFLKDFARRYHTINEL